MTDVPNTWPLNGHAPGNYMCRCLSCKQQFQGDKRAYQCLDCAVRQVQSLLSTLLAERERRTSSPGWPDPLESPQAEAIRSGKIDDVEIRNLFDQMEREIQVHRKAFCERRTPDVVTVPDGWKLVPIEPTEAMIEAANECEASWKSIWPAMLAAPSLSSGAGRSEE